MSRMTREENLHWLNEEIRTWENECQSKHPIKEALYAARKALEQEPCKDAVSRKKVWYMITGGKYSNEDYEQFIDRLVNELKELPSVTPQESILDKIRAEIEQNAYPIVHGVNNHELGMTLHGILQVIDKYKTESEKT